MKWKIITKATTSFFLIVLANALKQLFPYCLQEWLGVSFYMGFFMFSDML